METQISKCHYNCNNLSEGTLVHHPCPTLPVEFLKQKSQHEVQEIVQSHYGRVKLLLVDRDVEVKCPSYAYLLKQKRGLKLTIERIMTSSLRQIYPSFLVKKFGVVVSDG